MNLSKYKCDGCGVTGVRLWRGAPQGGTRPKLECIKCDGVLDGPECRAAVLESNGSVALRELRPDECAWWHSLPEEPAPEAAPPPPAAPSELQSSAAALGYELVPEAEARAQLGRSEKELGWLWCDGSSVEDFHIDVNVGASADVSVAATDFTMFRYGETSGWFRRKLQDAPAPAPAPTPAPTPAPGTQGMMPPSPVPAQYLRYLAARVESVRIMGAVLARVEGGEWVWGMGKPAARWGRVVLDAYIGDDGALGSAPLEWRISGRDGYGYTACDFGTVVEELVRRIQKEITPCND